MANFTVKRRENETVDSLISRFSAATKKSGIIKEVQERSYFKSKGIARREKIEKNRRFRQIKANKSNS